MMALYHLMRRGALVPISSCHLLAQLTAKSVLQHLPSVHLAANHRFSKHYFSKKSNQSCCFLHKDYCNQSSKSHQADLVGHTAEAEKSFGNILRRDISKHLSLSPMKNTQLISNFSTSSVQGAEDDNSIGKDESTTSHAGNENPFDEHTSDITAENIIVGGLLASLILYTWSKREDARDKLIAAVGRSNSELKSSLMKLSHTPTNSAEGILSGEAVSSQSHQLSHYNLGIEDSLITTMTTNAVNDTVVKVELTPFIQECESSLLPDPAQTGVLTAVESFTTTVDEQENDSLSDSSETNLLNEEESENIVQADPEETCESHPDYMSSSIPRAITPKLNLLKQEMTGKRMDAVEVGCHSRNFLMSLKKQKCS